MASVRAGTSMLVAFRAYGGAAPAIVRAGHDEIGGGGGPRQVGPGPIGEIDLDKLSRGVPPAGRGAAVSALPGQHGAQLVLPAVPRGVPLSRQLVREICNLLELDEVADVAELLASEVVTNAVLHAATDSLEVVIKVRDDQLVISVGDKDSHPPTMCHPTVESTGGRGLHLLDRLAERWGVTEWPQGKAVWFALPAHARHSHPPVGGPNELTN